MVSKVKGLSIDAKGVWIFRRLLWPHVFLLILPASLSLSFFVVFFRCPLLLNSTEVLISAVDHRVAIRTGRYTIRHNYYRR